MDDNSTNRRISNVSYLKWFRPVIEALQELNGSGTPAEVRSVIIKNENVSDEILSEKRAKSNQNKFDNEIAWARKYLVDGGYIDNTVHGIWTLTPAGKEVTMTDELATEIINNSNKALKTKNNPTIEEIIEQYKKEFDRIDSEERYKWEAIGWYKKHWDVTASDFAEMFKEAFRKHVNLLTASMYYPYQFVIEFAKVHPEQVRNLFTKLYDETLPLEQRYIEFRDGFSSYIDEKKQGLDKPKNLNHYQDLHAISVYLTFEYPEKYFIYKSKIYNGFKNLIGFQESSDSSQVRKILNNNRMCLEVAAFIKEDEELIKKHKDRLTKDCYQDPNFHLLAMDITYFGSRQKDTFGKGLGDEDVEETRYWIYSPGPNASKWEEFSSKGVMGLGWDELGDLSNYGTRSEIQDKLKELGNPDKSYSNDSLATWQFANVMKPGDVVYAKKGMYKLVGRGVVSSDYIYDADAGDEYKNLREVDWTDIGEWDHPGQAVMKTLTDISAYTEYVAKLEKLFANDNQDDAENEGQDKTWPSYSKEKFLEDVYLDVDDYETLVGLIREKMNVILQGAPGVGKTFAANRLAYSILGEKNKDRVMMVQFHQSYSYEDFIEGFRPSSDSNGFEIKKGSFYNFCKKAADDSEHDYFFIIDEINRGNLSKIFGELFMLIENDKRGNALQLLYSDEKFYVPSNVYIIGMMNTADRSLAMLDYALRRRFAFYEMKPAFDQKTFVNYRINLNSSKFNNLIECVKQLNNTITNDASLGDGFCIGHSYFCDLKETSDATLSRIIEYELIPLLKEYWFDEPTKVRDWAERLRSSIK